MSDTQIPTAASNPRMGELISAKRLGGVRTAAKLTRKCLRAIPHSLCHLPLSYSFMEGINDDLLHE
jgi:hypothetical protein